MRTSGVLMHISSLPSPYGIGTMGKAAYEFVDFLKEAGQTYWQILPLGQTGFGDSPYQSCSTYAGNPYFIDLDMLVEEGYLAKEDLDAITWCEREDRIDFGGLYSKRYPVLRKAFEVFKENLPADYDPFCWEQGEWLENYALFMAIKNDKNGASWDVWEPDLKAREPEAIAAAKKKLGMEMFFWKMLQYFFFRQWKALKAYANEKGIKIIGDLPIYVARDSVDVWSNAQLFDLDEDCNPKEVAGCPPDAFSEDGQLWGNPLYRWGEMRKDGYRWWMNRLRHMYGFYDVVRIDHFRGFESYFCIPAGDETAKNGYWRKGPGLEFFDTMKFALGDVQVFAEDLGYLTPGVRKMLRGSGYPGMKVLQFAFDDNHDNEYLPHNYIRNCVAYTGTHDNDTNVGWLRSLSKEKHARVADYLHLDKKEGMSWGMMRAIWASSADTAIVTMQDLLGLPGTARMNMPSTSGINWLWRAKPGYLKKGLAEKIYACCMKYSRLGYSEDSSWLNAEDDTTPIGEKLPVKKKEETVIAEAASDSVVKETAEEEIAEAEEA